MLYVQYVQYVQYGAQTLMVRVLEFVSGNADRNADKEHTRIATPPNPPNALPRNTATGPGPSHGPGASLSEPQDRTRDPGPGQT